MAEYAERDHMALGNFYTRHVEAMTAEGLHLKSDIAAELAWRDAEITRLRAALAQPVAVSADAEDWLRERFGVVRGHPEWRALIEAFDAGKALAQSAAPAVTADDYFTLLGHAIGLRGDGLTEMPAFFFDLAARIAPDAEHAARARQLAAAPQAPQPGERDA